MAIWIEIGLVVLLVLLNAAFSGSEMALVSLREGQLQRLEAQGRTGRALGVLARDPNQFLATVQIGITLAGFLASATAAVSLAEPLVGPLGFLGAAAEPVAVVLVTVVLTFVTLVVGELAPKRLAMQRAERWALMAARPLALVARTSRPVVWMLGRASDLVVRMLGGDPAVHRERVTQDEVRDLVQTEQVFDPQHRTVIAGAIEVAERQLRQVLVPRRDVVTIPAGTSVADGLAALAASGRSRAPVVREGLDDVVGAVHMRDLVGATGVVGDYARPCLFLPESSGVLDALRHLQQQRQKLAVVIDEHGAAEGIVTTEDLIEEVVGEIYDEVDRDVQAVVHEPDGSLRISGSFPVHDLIDVGVDVPSGDYATIAGLLLAELGHIPEPGESVVVDNWRITPTRVANRAIVEVLVSHAGDGHDTEPVG